MNLLFHVVPPGIEPLCIARRSGIPSPCIARLFDFVQMMSISVHKDHCTFFDYIKLLCCEDVDRE